MNVQCGCWQSGTRSTRSEARGLRATHKVHWEYAYVVILGRLL